MIGRIAVDSDAYETAAAVMADSVADGLNAVLSTLHQELAPSGGMAGSDVAGTAFADLYMPNAEAVCDEIAELIAANFQVASLLHQTALDHRYTDAASTVGTVGVTPETTSYGDQPLQCFAPPPEARGGSSSPPTGWTLIAFAVGYLWPNGHQDALRRAANAWRRAAAGLRDLVGYPAQASSLIADQSSIEVEDAAATVSAIGEHITDVAISCDQLAAACDEYAQHIDTAHSEIERELISLVEWSAGIQAVGAITAFLTAGVSEAPTQVAEASRVAAAARKVAALIETLVSAVRTLVAGLGAIGDRLSLVASRLRPLVAARHVPVELDAVGDAPAAVSSSSKLALQELRSGPLPKTTYKWQWYSQINKRGFIEYDVDKAGWPTTEYPHIHVVHNTAIERIEVNLSLGPDSHPAKLRLPIDASGTEVNEAVEQLRRMLPD